MFSYTIKDRFKVLYKNKNTQTIIIIQGTGLRSKELISCPVILLPCIEKKVNAINIAVYNLAMA